MICLNDEIIVKLTDLGKMKYKEYYNIDQIESNEVKIKIWQIGPIFGDSYIDIAESLHSLNVYKNILNQ